MHPFLDHPRPLAIAHRGGSLEGEENTLPAFAHAVRLGYSHLELDVHLTADGHVVIHHDPTLERMFRTPQAIADLTLAELRQIRSAGGATVPLLSELLEDHPFACVNIEPKSDAVVEPLADLIRKMGAIDRIGTGSFDPARTRQLIEAFGERLCWSPARLGVLGLWLRGWRLPLRTAGFQMVQVPTHFHGLPVVTPRFVRTAHKQGIQVQVWTVDDPQAMNALLDMGVDGVMTDRPTVLKQVLQARGEWRQTHA